MAAPFDDVNPVRKTYFINESERAVDPADDEGKVPQLEADGDFSYVFLRSIRAIKSQETINGISLPVPVGLEGGGHALRSQANVALRQNFIGFSRNSITPANPVVLGTPLVSTNATQSYTANAGSNVVLLVFDHWADSSPGNASLPSSYTWNGLAMTRVALSPTGGFNVELGVWVLALGNVASNTTANLVRTGGSGDNGGGQNIVAIQNVDQVNPFSDVKINTINSGVGTISVVPDQAIGLTLLHARDRVGAVTITASGSTSLLTGSTTRLNSIATAGNFTATTNNSNVGIIGVALNSASTVSARVQFQGVVGGFSGLTPGATYYVTNTIGTIGTSPGTANIPVGKAISKTEILIL